MRILPGQLTLDQLEKFYRNPETVTLDPICQQQVDFASDVVKSAAEGDEAIYGVNTGFGKLANKRIPPKKTAALQRNLILSHCCGMGPMLPDAIVRLIMLIKLTSLGRGASGVRWEMIQLLEAMLNAGIFPQIPAKGSVGASGDLAPLAHLTLAMIGEGKVSYQGEVVDATDALEDQKFSACYSRSERGLGHDQRHSSVDGNLPGRLF